MLLKSSLIFKKGLDNIGKVTMKNILVTAFVALLCSVTLIQVSHAANAVSSRLGEIVAVVNEEAITRTDLQKRISLAIASTGLPNTPEMRSRLTPQILRQMVDETLQVQEAKRYKITVSDAEVDDAISKIAEQNKMSVQKLDVMLKQHSASMQSLKEQTKAGLLWNKYSIKRLRDTQEISGHEINEVIERIKAGSGKTEYLLSEIYLPIDSTEQEAEAKNFANKLLEQIMKKKASFAALAAQFSRSASAAKGGDMGWIQQGQLPEEVDRMLHSSAVGQISMPIRTNRGLHIMAIRDKRTIMGADPSQIIVRIKQLFLPLSESGGGKEELQRLANKVRPELKDCKAMDGQIANYKNDISGDAGVVSMAQLPGNISSIISDLKVGEVSQPMTNREGVLFVMVCDRKMPEMQLPPRDKIATMLLAEKMALAQRRLLRDLRQAAFISIRG